MARLPMPFNNPTTYPGHEGVDYGQPRGTAIPASGPGRISKRTQTERGGLKVWVDYDEFPPGCDVGYAHLDNYNDSPPVGSRVETGQTIARVGNTGFTTGPHLHSEVEGHFTTDGYWQFFDPNRVVSAPLAGNQRQTGPYGAKARVTPDTYQPAVEEKYLTPGTVGTFDGWIKGEVVEGNPVWFHGAYSGLWFWSGGFTDTGTHDLTDMNPPAVAPNERVAVAGGSKARPTHSTDLPAIESAYIPAGEKRAFNGWAYGQDVQGNNVWFHRADVDAWHWSGGFTDVGTHDLADMNPKPEPEPDRNRTVAVAANVRDLPWRTSPVLSTSEPGAVIEMNAWAHADDVDGNDVWFRRADGDWQWSGGFTSQSTAGLPEVAAPPAPNPPSEYNPLGLPEYAPVYTRAVVGLEAPLGFENCQIGGVRAKRTEKGVPPNVEPTSGVIDRFIIHWAWPAGGDSDITYFSTCNDRGSCPTIYVTAGAGAIEFIRPGAKPAATGKDWNWRSWAVEVEPITDQNNINVRSVTDAQIDEIIEQMVFLREYNGKVLDGAPVEFLLDREHVLGHSDVASVECPGDYLYSKIDYMIAEAQRRYDERHPEPEPTAPLNPEEYPALWALRQELGEAFGH